MTGAESVKAARLTPAVFQVGFLNASEPTASRLAGTSRPLVTMGIWPSAEVRYWTSLAAASLFLLWLDTARPLPKAGTALFLPCHSGAMSHLSFESFSEEM